MFLITSLITRQVIHAQTAPAAGTSVVKMIDTMAMAQNVFLPAGTTLTFVLSQPLASSSGGTAAPAPVAIVAPAPATAQAPSPATEAPPAGQDAYYCRFYGQKDGHPITYVTPVFYESTLGHLPDRFYAYMNSTYDLSKIQYPQGQCERLSNVPALQANSMDMMEKQWAASKTEVIHLTWTDTPAENAAIKPAAPVTASNAPPAGGPFISCSTAGGAGFEIYVTGIFQTAKPVKQLPNGAKVVDQSILNDFYAFLTQRGYKFKPGSNEGCDVSPTEAAAKTAQHTRIYGGPGSCGYCGNKVVETGWKDQ
jgi:hypothetical protein